MPLLLGNESRLSASPVVLARAVCWRTPTNHLVLDQFTLALAQEKTGLVGANGTGKTTLARILVGELPPTSGSVARTGTVAYLPQDFTPLAACTVAQALGVRDKLNALARLTAGTGDADDLALLDDDWSLDARIAAELDRLGLGYLALDRPMGSLSGGETTRVVLAALFLQRPDLIILDEPTNNLDGDSRQALYGAVRSWRGGLLIVSHDRELLGLVDRIIELSLHGLRIYGGDFDVYTAQRDAEAAAAQHDRDEAAKQLRKARREAQAARERQERRSAHGRKYADKAGLPAMVINGLRAKCELTTARLAGVHEAKVSASQETLDEAKTRAAAHKELDITLAPVELPAGKTILDLEAVSFRHPGGPALFDDFHFRMVGPERVALVGPNGCGKTTLLKLILGQLTPASGNVCLGVERVTCLDQQASLLDPERSVLDNFRTLSPELSETVCRLTLARFLFHTDAVHRITGTLSGGERLRAALACVLTAVAPPQLLILDEPTNHLDLASLANLEQALRLYTGALLVVSHDRTFLDNIGVRRKVELPVPIAFTSHAGRR